MQQEYHIAVLDFSNYEVTLYKEVFDLNKMTKWEAVESFLAQRYNMDEIQYMYGSEQIAINNLTGYQID